MHLLIESIFRDTKSLQTTCDEYGIGVAIQTVPIPTICSPLITSIQNDKDSYSIECHLNSYTVYNAELYFPQDNFNEELKSSKTSTLDIINEISNYRTMLE